MRRGKALIALGLFAAVAAQLFTGSTAVEEEPSHVALEAVDSVHSGDQVPVAVNSLMSTGVVNGKLVVDYDPAMLSYEDTETGLAWPGGDDVVYAVNSDRDGQLILAFTGEAPAGEGTVFTLNFSAIHSGATELRFDKDSRLGGLNGGVPFEEVGVNIIGTPTGTPEVTPDALTYGQALSALELSGDLTCDGKPVAGAFAWVYPDTVPNAGNFEAEWTFTPENTAQYDSTRGFVTVTVKKALPTGEPSYIEIVIPHRTLADAAIGTGSIDVAGTVTWDLPIDTQVEIGRSYSWTFTPTDGDNYELLTGSIVIWPEDEPHEHTWGGWEETTPATCTESGERSHTCTVCGEIGTETTDPLGHDFKDGICTRCGADHDHVWGDWEETTPATCTESGERTRTCTVCGESETEVIDPLGHDYKDGICTRCGVEHEHVWGDWEETTPAACTESGERTRACPGCGKSESEVIDPLGHDYNNGVCTRCGDPDPNWNPVPPVPSTPSIPEKPVCDGGETCPCRVFSDLDLEGEEHEAMDYMVSRGLMSGVTGTLMSPDGPMTRASAVTVLYRAAGSPVAPSGDPFVDLRPGGFYRPSVVWAWNQGITRGVSRTSFDPDANVSRQQMATFLYRYAHTAGFDTFLGADLSGCPDVDRVGHYAMDAMRWAVYHNIIEPAPDGRLDPLGSVTRAQAARMIWRLLDALDQ